MGVVRSGHFWQLGSITSLDTETTGEEILEVFWPKHGLRTISECLIFKIFPGGACPSLFTLKCNQWLYQSKIAGSGPVTGITNRE